MIRALTEITDIPKRWVVAISSKVMPRSWFARGVMVLMGGTVGGQAIVVLTSPIVTRLYSPDDFGVFAAFGSLLAILGSFATLRYDLAIPLPETDEDAAAVAGMGLVSSVLVGLLVWLGAKWFGAAIADYLNVPALRPYLWLLPVGVTLAGIYQVGYYWATRVKDFGAIARTKMTQSLGMVAVQVLGYSFGPLALVAGRVVGECGGSLVLWKRAWKHHGGVLRRLRISRLKWAARRYARFPLFSTWVAGLNALGAQLPPLLLAGLFGPVPAGAYAVTHRFLALPMTLIGRAMSDAFFARAADAARCGELGTLVTRVHELLARIAVPASLILIVGGPDIFATVLGEGWRQAGEFAQWMVPWTILVFMTSPLRSVLTVTERQAESLLFEMILLAVRVASLVIGGILGSLQLAIALFSLGSASCWLGLLLWVLRVSGANSPSALLAVAKSLLAGTVAVVPLVLSQSLLRVDYAWYVGLAASVALLGVYYARLLRRFSS